MIRALNDAQTGVGYVGALKRKGNVVWAVGGAWGSPVVFTSDGGRTFRRRKPPEANGLRDVLPFGDKHALVVGEAGALFVTKDAETWKQIPTGTTACLFSLERAHGSIWLSGDEGFVLSSTDGTAWRKPKLGTHLEELGRIQRLVHAVGALWLLGYEGKLGVVKKDEVELASLESDSPVTAIAFNPRGVGIVVGDAGTVFRTTNKGKTWTQIDTGVEADLEDVIWASGRFIVVGEDATVLVSEDGETFRSVDTGRDEHFWCAMADGAAVLIGGDGGLVLRAEEAELAEATAIAVGDEEDEQEEEEEDQEAVTLAETPLGDAELEAASKRWITEGKRFYEELNAFVAQFYQENAPKLDDEPEEPRKDMATFVQRVAVQLNREKRFDDLRRMFPPSFEVFDYDAIGQSVDPALYTDDGAILVRASGIAYRVEGDIIEPLQGVKAFGRSRDRKHFAFARGDQFEIRQGSRGAVHTTIPIPKAIGAIKTIEVFPDGERLLVASPRGVFVVSNRGTEKIHGKDEESSMSYVHAALSPDGRFIACGDQDSTHRIFSFEGGAAKVIAEIQPRSSYPHFAIFHDDGKHVCLSACHFSESSSLGLELDVLKHKGKKPITMSGFDGDDRLTVIDGRRWMYSGISRDQGYVLGDRNGYAWYLGFDGALLAYVHVGATMESIDVDAANEHILFATCAGLLVEFDRKIAEPDLYKVISFRQGREKRRWVFWRGFPPLVW